MLVAINPYNDAEARAEIEKPKSKQNKKQKKDRPDQTAADDSALYNAIYIFVDVGLLKMNFISLLPFPRELRSFLIDATVRSMGKSICHGKMKKS